MILFISQTREFVVDEAADDDSVLSPDNIDTTNERVDTDLEDLEGGGTEDFQDYLEGVDGHLLEEGYEVDLRSWDNGERISDGNSEGNSEVNKEQPKVQSNSNSGSTNNAKSDLGTNTRKIQNDFSEIRLREKLALEKEKTATLERLLNHSRSLNVNLTLKVENQDQQKEALAQQLESIGKLYELNEERWENDLLDLENRLRTCRTGSQECGRVVAKYERKISELKKDLHKKTAEEEHSDGLATLLTKEKAHCMKEKEKLELSLKNTTDFLNRTQRTLEEKRIELLDLRQQARFNLTDVRLNAFRQLKITLAKQKRELRNQCLRQLQVEYKKQDLAATKFRNLEAQHSLLRAATESLEESLTSAEDRENLLQNDLEEYRRLAEHFANIEAENKKATEDIKKNLLETRKELAKLKLSLLDNTVTTSSEMSLNETKDCGHGRICTLIYERASPCLVYSCPSICTWTPERCKKYVTEPVDEECPIARCTEPPPPPPPPPPSPDHTGNWIALGTLIVFIVLSLGIFNAREQLLVG